jgi:hypothetical protein
MSNETLKENEKSLFRRVYLARIAVGASIEAAEKQALHAVKRWNALGALNEDRTSEHEQEIERLRGEIEVYENASSHLGELCAMLRNYGLPTEPKAFAKEIEWSRKTNAAELKRLYDGFAIVREVLADPDLDRESNAVTLFEQLGEFVAGKIDAVELRKQFYSPDSGPRAEPEEVLPWIHSRNPAAELSPEDRALFESRAWKKLREFLEREEPTVLSKIVAFFAGAKAGEELHAEDASAQS